MTAKLLEGKPIAEGLKAKIKAEVEALKARHGKAPKLAALQIGENASSARRMGTSRSVSTVACG